jgi:hypothetical protein
MADVENESVEELDALPFDELRHRAFRLAEHRLDIHFFWDLIEHLHSSSELATEDASAGNITGSFEETLALVRELVYGDVSEDEQALLRARFIDYLRRHA